MMRIESSGGDCPRRGAPPRPTGRLSQSNIEADRPGYPPEYYELFKHLDEVIAEVVKFQGLDVWDFQLMDGDSSAVISCSGREQRLILKVSPWGDLGTEVYFYDKLKERDFPVPQLLAADLSMTEVPFMYELLEFVEGEGVGELPAEWRRGAAAIVGETLAHVHEIAVDGFGSITAGGRWSHAEGRESLRDIYLATDLAEQAPKVFLPREIEAVHHILQLDELLYRQPRLTHGDAVGSNFLFAIDESRPILQAIIDPDIVGGDPMCDVAMATNDFDNFAHGFLDGYSRVHHISGQDMQRMRLLQVLTLFWSACWQYAVGGDHREPLRNFRTLLGDLDA